MNDHFPSDPPIFNVEDGLPPKGQVVRVWFANGRSGSAFWNGKHWVCAVGRGSPVIQWQEHTPISRR